MSSSKQKISGAAIAVAAAGLLFTAGVGSVSAADEAKIHCAGVNACKGKSECKSAKSECKGQNACKGQGVTSMSEKECTAKKGTPAKS
jgi:hypothetical protein